MLHSLWYGRTLTGAMIAPLGWFFATGVRLRRLLYRVGVLRGQRVGAPVIVVGNIVAGGTGKTPLVTWIARFLAKEGYRPGIVCRGYGGRATRWPQQVRPDADPFMVGDEAVLLARRGGCPVAAGPDRIAASRALVEHAGCDVVVSDDGLQHLRLARDVEIAVVDGERRHGNGRCLPAGPLREPVSRLRSVDLVVSNGAALQGEFAMRLAPWHALAADGSDRKMPLEGFRGRRVHGLAGIGNPERFFRMLEGHGMTVVRHSFPDHHPFASPDLELGDDAPVIMTEKDAVKCARFAGAQVWYVPVRAELHPAFAARLLRLLRSERTDRARRLDRGSARA
jgi:tetraacyldisaccharide 4'-kinase